MTRPLFLAPILATALFTSSPALSGVLVNFSEGAPKDRFTFKNTGKCGISRAKITLDLSASKSGLIFDVTNSGAGVEVFQPLQIVAGRNSLASVPKVKDGDNRIVFNIKQLKAGSSFAFTIDVDDTTSDREITVNGSEISGARVRFEGAKAKGTGTFNSKARAVVNVNNC